MNRYRHSGTPHPLEGDPGVSVAIVHQPDGSLGPSLSVHHSVPPATVPTGRVVLSRSVPDPRWFWGP